MTILLALCCTSYKFAEAHLIAHDTFLIHYMDLPELCMSIISSFPQIEIYQFL